MNKEEFLTLGEYFIRLVRYGVDGGKEAGLSLPVKAESIRWEDVYALADRHSLCALCYSCVKDEEMSDELKAKWERAYRVAVHADVLQLFAWEEIRETLPSKGLKILPLKGIHVKKLYPHTSLRQMGDLDILYDAKDFSLLKKTLEGLGYSYQKESGKTNHQIFFREPVVEVEFHSNLMPEGVAYRAYYESPWERAVQTETENLYAFSREDEYVYQVLHAAKHYGALGSGVRTVADFHLYLQKYGSSLNREYIDAQLQKADDMAQSAGHEAISAVQFEKALLQTVCDWFDGDEIVFSEIALCMLSDGVYGKAENAWQKGYEKSGKKKYLLSRLFPPYSVMKKRNPCLKKFPFLLPFFWIGRLFKGLKNKKRTMAEYEYIRKADEKNSRL